jgi:hypothetical protein
MGVIASHRRRLPQWASSTLVITCVFATALSRAAWAIGDLRFSGFVTAGAAISDNKNTYLPEKYNDNANYRGDSVFGLQIDAKQSEKARISGQLVANDYTNFAAEAEWLYLAYQVNPEWTLRAGRLRLPLNLMSEYIHVGRAYLWVSPPEEVYGLSPFTRFHGVDVIHRIQLNNSALDIQAYTGQIHDKIEFFDMVTTGVIKESYGLNFTLEGQRYRVRLGTNNLRGEFLTSASTLQLNGTHQNAAFSYDIAGFETIFEWAKVDSDALFAGNPQGGYITLAHPFGDWTPHFTYGYRKHDDADKGTSTSSHSYTLGVKLDDANRLTWKAEIHHGEANDGALGLFNVANAALLTDPRVNLVRFTVSTVF